MSKTLPEFQEFLLARKLALEKHVPYYAYWVSNFLSFSNNHEDLNVEARGRKFLQHLRSEKDTADWQVEQAQTALKLYISNFLNGDTSTLYPNGGAQQMRKPTLDYSHVTRAARDAIRLKHYSYRTERSYIGWIKRFYGYVTDVKKKDIKTRGVESSDVRDFLSHLAIKQKVSSSTQNQAFNAILFLFRDVLNIELKDLGKTVRAKRGFRLPVVLTVKEVQEIFNHVNGNNLIILQLLYGSGLRLMELARLRVKDIDFHSSLIFVRGGKGDKDRSTVLPECVKTDLRLHLEKVKALHEEDLEAGHGEVSLPDALERKYSNAAGEWKWQYVFPAQKLSVDPQSGKIRRHHVGEKSIQNAVRRAVKEAGIAKHATVHTLRHSFATHLLMNGVNIREIQELLGHKNLETTMIYTHVLRNMSSTPKSPLDSLYADFEEKQNSVVYPVPDTGRE